MLCGEGAGGGGKGVDRRGHKGQLIVLANGGKGRHVHKDGDRRRGGAWFARGIALGVASILTGGGHAKREVVDVVANKEPRGVASGAEEPLLGQRCHAVVNWKRTRPVNRHLAVISAYRQVLTGGKGEEVRESSVIPTKRSKPNMLVRRVLPWAASRFRQGTETRRCCAHIAQGETDRFLGKKKKKKNGNWAGFSDSITDGQADHTARGTYHRARRGGAGRGFRCCRHCPRD